MRKLILFLIIIQHCSLTFGQMATDNLAINSNIFEQNLISENCNNSINWESNKRCIEREINSLIQQKFDFNKTSNFEPGEYMIHSKFKIDLQGNISNVYIDSRYKIIKNEFYRIFELFPKTFRLVNKNSEPMEGSYKFPTKIRILE